MQLFEDILAAYDDSQRSDESPNPFGGTTYSIIMELGTGRKYTFRTVWEERPGEAQPKLITAYRDRRVSYEYN